ncbi:1,4-alpha-glucan branching protein GlgB [Alkalibacter rhizosphaerae]|uniref:1,4-alpha-glucan branching enzyme GlgB n=1 Tax=Alkalibacter rhizosphaerae TaxID=2815577 RepID=A0A974XH55_9FIRM|nr:1,4-alpha-glucan branching protein GlgB [Alkalibacter rhizosphaerae]QSX08640.1 1,4-alpha-glucan branching protein GlgB [Alkalibacter rhizosphaerae]
MANEKANPPYYYSNKGSFDAHLFHEGTFYRSYEFLGAHPYEKATRFVVWAPRAQAVFVVGDFNDWQEDSLPMERIHNSGLWEICISGVETFDKYKYRIIGQDGSVGMKADPYGFHSEERPGTASKFFDITKYRWKDRNWIKNRNKTRPYDRPISIYEMNLLSWKKGRDESQLSYSQIAKELVVYLKKTGFTHVELMPVMEHPFDGSWGYQTTGYYAPTSRYGTPKDFMAFVDLLHQNGFGVILDWAPAHFCRDDHGLRMFDGTACFESVDNRRADNIQWGTSNFDFSKPEVLSFLISNAMYWHEYFHIDGLRIDAVAYMLYLNFAGADLKNEQGGFENFEAIEFIRKLNKVVFEHFPGTMMIAEESTAWPLVTGPVDQGGLGFNFKWNMGWMNDILDYMETDPLYRKGKQHALTFSITYAFSENFVLPLSHDEVAHGKRSLLDKMPGEYEQKFANLRLLYLYMFTHPGKKLLFMGGEFAQFIEWNEWQELDWFLLDYELHGKMLTYVSELNKFYKEEKPLYELDESFDGFDWVEHENHQESILIYERVDRRGDRLLIALNFTPVARTDYPIGVMEPGSYKTVFHSDRIRYGGNTLRPKSARTRKQGHHHRPYSITVDIPALGGVVLKNSPNQTTRGKKGGQ